MSPDKFDELSSSQQMTLLLSMHIRNSLEEFHVRYVQDNAMPELNSTIRYAIYEFFDAVMKSERSLNWLALMTPEYWEIPGRDPRPEFTGEYLWEGKPNPTKPQE